MPDRRQIRLRRKFAPILAFLKKAEGLIKGVNMGKQDIDY